MSFDPYAIFIGFIFGVIGFSSWRYGRHRMSERHMILGVLLMGYNYFISDIWFSLGIGSVLTVLLFWP